MVSLGLFEERKFLVASTRNEQEAHFDRAKYIHNAPIYSQRTCEIHRQHAGNEVRVPYEEMKVFARRIMTTQRALALIVPCSGLKRYSDFRHEHSVYNISTTGTCRSHISHSTHQRFVFFGSLIRWIMRGLWKMNTISDTHRKGIAV